MVAVSEKYSNIIHLFVLTDMYKTLLHNFTFQTVTMVSPGRFGSKEEKEISILQQVIPTVFSVYHELNTLYFTKFMKTSALEKDGELFENDCFLLLSLSLLGLRHIVYNLGYINCVAFIENFFFSNHSLLTTYIYSL